MKKAVGSILFLIFATISFAQENKNLPAESSKYCCIITEVSIKKRIITAENKLKGNYYTLTMNAAIIRKIKKGDTIDFDASDITENVIKLKNIKLYINNQTVLSTSSVRRKDPNALDIRLEQNPNRVF